MANYRVLHRRGFSEFIVPSLTLTVCMKILFILLPLAFLAGCAVPKSVNVTSDPPGANVYASERLVGTTPFRAGSDNLFPNRYWDGRLGTYDTLIFKRPGYLEAGYPVSEWNLPKEIHVKLERQ